MAFAKKAVILGVFLCAQAAATFWLSSPAARTHRTRIISDFHVDGWTDADIVDRTGILDQLEADASAFKVYSNSRGEQVVLYIGYYDTLQKAKMSHAPQVCFTAQGWVIEGKSKRAVRCGGGLVTVNQMRVQKSQEGEVVYYWYQSPDRMLPDLFLLKLDMLKNSVLNRDRARGRNAFVRLSTPISGDQASAEARLDAFLASNVTKLNADLFQSGREESRP